MSDDETFFDGSIELRRGEALGELASLDRSFDALITDPPYSSGGTFRADRASGSANKYLKSADVSGATFAGDMRDQHSYLMWSVLWLTECRRMIRNGGIACVFTDWRQLPVVADALQAGGFVYRGVVVWQKAVARPRNGFSPLAEFIVWGSVGEDMRCVPGAITAANAVTTRRHHPVEKPLAVMRHLLCVLPDHASIVDPFCGGGASLVAAAQLGRSALGIEVDEHWHGVAAERLRDAEKGRLFA